MIPYRGRLSLRIARTALALACLGWYGLTAGLHLNWLTALLTAYVVYSFGALAEVRYDSAMRSPVGVFADTLYFGLWAWYAPGAWMSSMAAGYLLGSACMLQDVARTGAVAVVAVLLALLLPTPPMPSLVWTVGAAGAVASGISFYKRYLDERMSSLLRNNLIIRSQAERAREAERQRIAADFHDGPLQSFISFQMRLEIIRKLLLRDQVAATEELLQLQELCKAQVNELRTFVRSMRPVDVEGSLTATLRRVVEQFQKDSGIPTTFVSTEFLEPAEPEVSLELLQIVREALYNVQKHSCATRVAVSIAKNDTELEITVEDNGAGFPFSGRYTLDELELLRLGPVSIKRRVRTLGGDLTLDSKPGQGAGLKIRLAT